MRAPATGRLPSSSRPVAICSFDPVGCHVRTKSSPSVAIRAAPGEAATRATRFGATAGAAAAGTACATGWVASARRGSTGGGDCCLEPPSAKIWSRVAVPPADEVGVPPTVIAMYSLPSTV